MLENNRLNELLLRFPEDVQLIFKDMIPSYQLGYADYVYQTDKVDTQNRRIKNLSKNFRKMNYFYVMPLPQELALEIANDWRYDPPYDLYNADKEFLSPEARGDRFFAVIRNGALMGYFSLEESGDQLTLSLAMKPSLLGLGNGRAFYQAIEGYVKDQYSPVSLSLTVANFHQRAQSLFRTCGYLEIGRFQQVVNGSQLGYIEMKKEMRCD